MQAEKTLLETKLGKNEAEMSDIARISQGRDQLIANLEETMKQIRED